MSGHMVEKVFLRRPVSLCDGGRDVDVWTRV